MRSKLRIFALCSLFGLLFGCEKNGTDLDKIILSEDAHLLSFYLASDSISYLSDTKFSIDQRNGKIFNKDSLVYQTSFKDKVKIIFTKGNNSSTVTWADQDTVKIASGDTIKITDHLMGLKVLAPDGLRTKHYELRINIHQADPDSISYNRIANNVDALNADLTKTILFRNNYYLFSKKGSELSLYQSEDLVNWEAVATENLPSGLVIKQIVAGSNCVFAHTETGELYMSDDLVGWDLIESEKVVAILGLLYKSSIQTQSLSLIVEKENQSLFACFQNQSTWKYGKEVPTEFPVNNFSSVSYARMNTQRITVTGGEDINKEVLASTWSTEDGYYWARMNSKSQSLPKIKNHNVFIYNGRIFAVNGENDNGVINTAVYSSVDGGITWETMANKYLFPSEYNRRYNASVIVDEDAVFFYVIGGEGVSKCTDIWRGVRNGLMFDN
ncbi:DUF6242 domain-containing protein [Bacteroidales bacterium OttesenSCG-928-M11]|nr:DUF6242 domain-containing protein [Bacteroidales bacterium OttesenSCG-928-M11]